MADAAPPQLLIWTDARRVGLVERVAGLLGPVDLQAVGGPRRGEVVELAQHLGATAADDFRRMIVETPAPYLLLATVAGVKAADIDLALAQGMTVFTLEPVATRSIPATTATGEAGTERPGRLLLTPLLRCSPAYLAAVDPLQATGQVHSLAITSIGTGEQATLYARLADAVDAALALIGMPDQVDAALAGPLAEPPDDLRGLVGHMTVNLHGADGSAACLHASNQSPIFRRSLVAVGREATLLLDDQRYQLYANAMPDDSPPGGTDGAVELDTPPQAPANQPLEQSGDAGAVVADYASLIAAQWRHVIAQSADAAGLRVDRQAVVGICQTALLSVRTGQSESTDKLARYV